MAVDFKKDYGNLTINNYDDFKNKWSTYIKSNHPTNILTYPIVVALGDQIIKKNKILYGV